jgi:DNA-binding NarL/FixJ family response regulator
MCGRETLGLVKRDAVPKSIPVIVLTTSDAEADVSICYRLGVNCCFRKPAQWDQFDDLLRKIGDFWFCKVELPSIKAGRLAIQLVMPDRCDPMAMLPCPVLQ